MPDATPFPAPHARRDPWQDRPAPGFEYHLRTEADADVLCRLLGLFAQLQLVPRQLHVERKDSDMQVILQLTDLSAHRAAVLAEKLRALVCIWQVEWLPLDHDREQIALRTG
ncbi:MAG TPA: hypothetical protein VGE28_15305 [Pseudomonas sp.]